MTEPILVQAHDNWTEITLNRPDRLNRFTDEMHLALRTALELARTSGQRCVLLTGAGRGFCAGQGVGDLDASKIEGKPVLGLAVWTFYAPLVHPVRSLDFPVVCAVNGIAAGAGATIALACNAVIATESAKFIQSFAEVGLIPDTGGSWHLTRLLGEARAKRLAQSAEPLSAQQAEDWRLIWKAVPDEQLITDARALASSFANGPTQALGLTKHAIRASATNTLSVHLDLEADLMKTCDESTGYTDGVSALLEKRSPSFVGW